MGYIMPFTDASGQICSNSYWRVSQLSLSPADQTATIFYTGYPTKTSREDGLAPLNNGEHQFTVNAAAYAMYLSPAAQATANKDVIAQAYTYVDAQTIDTFFAGATEA